MPSEALSDGIFYCLCRFVSGWQCRRRGIVVPPFGFSDGIGGFGRHRGFGGLKPTLPLLTNHPDKPNRRALNKSPPTKNNPERV
ncbi:hypothetical protein [Neisseria polysaccharea]|uniref:hypothetical protein n=1 Tax=Neisseria polysaccharea TaxID=489 RepID=UPI001111C2F8